MLAARDSGKPRVLLLFAVFPDGQMPDEDFRFHFKG